MRGEGMTTYFAVPVFIVTDVGALFVHDLISRAHSPLKGKVYHSKRLVSGAGSNGRCNSHRIGSFHNAFEEGPTCKGDLQLDLKQGSFL